MNDRMVPIQMMTPKVARLIAKNSLPYVKCFSCRRKRYLSKDQMINFLLDARTQLCSQCKEPMELERH